MNLQQELETKQNLLKQKIEQINQLQQALNTAQQDAIRIDGAIVQIKEMITTEEESKKEVTEEVVEAPIESESESSEGEELGEDK